MGKLSEQQVLNKLHIENFRQVRKDQVIKLANMLPELDPEVAKKALEQLPDCAANVKEIVTHFMDAANKGLDHNSENVKSFNRSCELVLNICEKMIAEGDLSFEQKNTIIQYTMTILDKQAEMDRVNKEFIANIVGKVATAAALTVVAILVPVGLNANISK